MLEGRGCTVEEVPGLGLALDPMGSTATMIPHCLKEVEKFWWKWVRSLTSRHRAGGPLPVHAQRARSFRRSPRLVLSSYAPIAPPLSMHCTLLSLPSRGGVEAHAQFDHPWRRRVEMIGTKE